MNDPRDFIERNVPENNISLYLKTGLTDEYWRMHFAGLAMQGIISLTRSMDMTDEQVANGAFKVADAMIAQSKEVK